MNHLARSTLWILSGLVVVGCGDDAAPDPTPPSAGPIHFVDEAESRGLDHINHCGEAGQKRFLLETLGVGCALADFDGDDDLDVYLVDAATLEKDGELFVPAGDGRCLLYENDGEGHFEVVESSGADLAVFGMGVTAVDTDGDGDQDLYVTCWGPNRLLENRGELRFEDVTESAGVGDERWSVGACWLDADRDGNLDLYVANYFSMSVDHDPECWEKVDCGWLELTAPCGPKGMVAEPDTFYRGRGDGTFEDSSVASGIREVEERFGLGTVAFDSDVDGDIDIYVANDSRGNFLFENDGHAVFSDVAEFYGAALNRSGLAQAGMGVACGDFDQDLDLDLFLTNFSSDNNTLYRNTGGEFEDVTIPYAFGEPMFFDLGWGTEFVDFDNDGGLELFVGNGHIYPQADTRAPEMIYRQSNRIYRFEGERAVEVTGQAGPGLAKLSSTRGAAFGDVDGDGDLDALLTEMNDRPTLLINQRGSAVGASLILRLVGADSNRDAIGARAVAQVGPQSILRAVRAGDSYASSSDRRLHFGLGTAKKVDRLTVTWPNGAEQTATDLVHGFAVWHQGEDRPRRRSEQ